MSTPMTGRLARRSLVGLAIAGLVASLPARAASFEFANGVSGDFNTTLSFGVQVRMKDRLRNNIGNDNGGDVPTTGAIGGRINGDPATSNPDFNFLQGDDGNLNYDKHDIVSAVLKGTHELGLKYQDWKFLARGSWIYDFKIDDTRSLPLAPDAYKQAVRDTELLDLWVSKDFQTPWGLPGQVRLGNQVISWGEDIFIVGGVNSINALDLRRFHVPGTQLKEIFRPAPMAYVNTAIAPGFNLEAYYQFRWNGFKFDPVGTFFSGADVIGKGQRPAFIPSSILGEAPGTFGDRGDAAVYGVNVLPFEQDRTPPNSKQYGAAFRFKPKNWDTEWALYYVRYHDKLPFTTLFTETDPASPYMAANVIGAGYYNEYGKDKDIWGVSFNTKVGPVAVGGELSYRPRDSVGIDGSVPLSGPYSIFDPSTPGPAKTYDPLTQRTTVRGYVDEKKWQAHLTGFYFIEVNSPIGTAMKALGAAEGYVLAEAAVAHYPNLKPSEIPYYVFPSYEVPDKTSWGYVVEVALTYPNVFNSGINLVPQIDFTHDVSGITPNALPFVEGRKSFFFGLNFDSNNIWKGQIGYTHYWGGGVSNTLRDRDFLGANISYSF
ncbi:MAG: DUF1302 domain-containing protein [Burkholderiales bacterium]